MSWTLKRLFQLGQADVGKGASGRRNRVNDRPRAKSLNWLLCGTQEEGWQVVGWDYGGEISGARLRRGSVPAELHSRNPMFW